MSNNKVYVLIVDDGCWGEPELEAFKSKEMAREKFTKLLDDYLRENYRAKDSVQDIESRCLSYEKCIEELYFSSYEYTLTVKELDDDNSNEVYVMKILDDTFDQIVSGIKLERLHGPVIEFKLFRAKDDARKKFTEIFDNYINEMAEDMDCDTKGYIDNCYNDIIERLSFMNPGFCEIRVMDETL